MSLQLKRLHPSEEFVAGIRCPTQEELRQAARCAADVLRDGAIKGGGRLGLSAASASAVSRNRRRSADDDDIVINLFSLIKISKRDL